MIRNRLMIIITIGLFSQMKEFWLVPIIRKDSWWRGGMITGNSLNTGISLMKYAGHLKRKHLQWCISGFHP